MEDTTSGGQTIYQGRVSNNGRGFSKNIGNSYYRSRGRGFDPTKTKVWGKFEALGSYIYSIGYALQADKYTKTKEAILDHIQINFNKWNDVKDAFRRTEWSYL